MTVTVPAARAGVEERVERLARSAARRVIDPDQDIPGGLTKDQVLPDELLTVSDLGLVLTPEQKATLSREEVASMLDVGTRFEMVLNAGFSLMIAKTDDLTDPRVRFLLHEIGEETRHSRMFIRLIEQLDPQAEEPFRNRKGFRNAEHFFISAITAMPATFDVLVLAGEEIPDLFQKLASEHPDTDPFLAEVNRYHRMEEARHISYARTVFPELWNAAGAIDRRGVRQLAPRMIMDMYRFFVHPGVYRRVGLPGWKTWKAANATPWRVGLRHQATRPILRVLLETDGVFPRGTVNKAWRELCGVDERGEPVA